MNTTQFLPRTLVTLKIPKVFTKPWKASRSIVSVSANKRRDADSQSAFENAKSYAEVPKPKGLPFFGTVPYYILNGGGKYLHEYVHRRHSQLGPIYKEKYSTEPFEVLFVGDIEGARDVYRNEGKTPLSFVIGGEQLYMELSGVKRGLLFCQGEDWLRLRRPMNQLLLRRNDYFTNFDLTSEVIEEHLMTWEDNKGSKVSDLGMKVNTIAVCTFGAFALGNTFSRHRAQIESDARALYVLTKNYWEANMTMQLIPPKWAHRLKLPVWTKFESSISSMLAIGKNWVQLATEDMSQPEFTTQSKGGLLHLMLSDEYNDKQENSALRLFSDFLPALESESTMIHWILYVMGQNPEAQVKLHRELDNILGNSGRLTWDSLETASYLNACIKESLRMYPSNCFTVRILPTESVVKGYRVPGGTIAVVALLTAQCDPLVFQDPDRFWPERWSRTTDQTSVDGLGAETEIGKPLGVQGCQPYLPFAWGSSRGCVFRRISVRRMSLFFAKFVTLFEFTTQPVRPVMRSLMIPDRDIQLSVRRRT